MSGHSKWANIKRKKEKTDAQKGKVFTKIGRELAIAVKMGGSGDPNANSRLKDVIAKAKANNIPNDNIARSIKKAAGEIGNANYEEITYEGYGPGGSAIIVEAVTDNKNRTAAEMRHVFDKSGGSLGASGCVSWMFDRKGVIMIEKRSDMDDDEVMMTALDAGAEDINDSEDIFEILTDPADFSTVREKLENLKFKFVSAEIEMIPQNSVSLDDETSQRVSNMVETLEDNDDVQNVYHNVDLPEQNDEEE